MEPLGLKRSLSSIQRWRASELKKRYKEMKFRKVSEMNVFEVKKDFHIQPKE